MGDGHVQSKSYYGKNTGSWDNSFSVSADDFQLLLGAYVINDLSHVEELHSY